ncbi:MAG: hypothetical protein ABEJ31_10935 [Haloarculaceae archaeon]
MSDETPQWPGTAMVDWYVEAARKTIEQTLEAQQRAIDGWADAVEGHTEAESVVAGPARQVAWAADIWLETLENGLTHLDDAFSAEGVDLEQLQTIWLHAADDAITDVGETEAFADSIAAAAEGELGGIAWWRDVSESMFEAAGLPTDRDVAEVGERLLALEYRQKAVEDKLEAVIDAVGAERTGRHAREIAAEADGGAAAIDDENARAADAADAADGGEP